MAVYLDLPNQLKVEDCSVNNQLAGQAEDSLDSLRHNLQLLVVPLQA